MNAPRRAWKSKFPGVGLVGDARPLSRSRRIIFGPSRGDSAAARVTGLAPSPPARGGGRPPATPGRVGRRPASFFVVGRTQDDPGRGCVQPEALRGQRARSSSDPEPRRQRQPVGHRPVRPAQAVALRAFGTAGFDQDRVSSPSEHVAPGMPDVFAGVEAGHPEHRVVPESTVGPGPPHERPDAGPVVVDRLQAQPLGHERREGLLDLRRLQGRRTGSPRPGLATRVARFCDRSACLTVRPLPTIARCQSFRWSAIEPAPFRLAADRRRGRSGPTLILCGLGSPPPAPSPPSPACPSTP